ncbi:alpha/beta hydrolase [Rhizobium sp. G21]|uniref:alpha/beta fold hydrolase n=1 Tax=Rhizobium sp. G21 TaxID=2758439 RepID=UPI0028B13034|nr:alpha/beta hydrolase [Rhizobium sp. G21]
MTPSHADAWNARKRTIDLPAVGRMAFIDTGGAGPTLLLLHGFSDTSRSFAYLEPLLRGYRLIMPDMPGHGGSAPMNEMHVADFATSIVSLMHGMEVTPAAIIGHSMGAMTTLEIAGRSFDGPIVLLSASLNPGFGDDNDVALAIRSLRDPIDPASAFLREWYACASQVNAEFLDTMRREAAAMPAKLWRAIADGFEQTDLTSTAARISNPALSISGLCDTLFGRSHRQDLSETLRSAEFVALAEVGHNPHWEAPDVVAGRILSFLREHGVANTIDA